MNKLFLPLRRLVMEYAFSYSECMLINHFHIGRKHQIIRHRYFKKTPDIRHKETILEELFRDDAKTNEVLAEVTKNERTIIRVDKRKRGKKTIRSATRVINESIVWDDMVFCTDLFALVPDQAYGIGVAFQRLLDMDSCRVTSRNTFSRNIECDLVQLAKLNRGKLPSYGCYEGYDPHGCTKCFACRECIDGSRRKKCEPYVEFATPMWSGQLICSECQWIIVGR